MTEELNPTQKLQAEYNHVIGLIGHNEAQQINLAEERTRLVSQLKKIMNKANNLPKEKVEAIKEETKKGEETHESTVTKLPPSEFKVKLGAPRKVTHAYLHQSPMWPGGQEIQDTSLTPMKHPTLKMLWIPNDGLLIQDQHGNETTISSGNVINVVHPKAD